MFEFILSGVKHRVCDGEAQPLLLPHRQGPGTFTSKGRKGRWGPAQRGGPRAAGGKGRGCSEGPRATGCAATCGPGSGGPQGLGERCSGPPPPPPPACLATETVVLSGCVGVRAGGVATSQGPPAQPRGPVGSGGCGQGQGSGAYPSLRRPSLCLSLPAPPASLPPVTSLLGTSKCKMQKPGPTAAWRPAPAAAQAASRPSPPEPEARSADGRRDG